MEEKSKGVDVALTEIRRQVVVAAPVVAELLRHNHDVEIRLSGGRIKVVKTSKRFVDVPGL